MFKNILKSIIAMVGITLASQTATASILDLKIGAAQIFDVQYSWSHSTDPTTPDYNCYGDASACDVLNVSGLTQPYETVGPNGNFAHPTLTSGQYYGFINSPTNPGTYGMAVFNADGTQAYIIHNTGDLYKVSNDGIFFVGGGFFGTVITPSEGYSYNSSATLNVGTGTPTSSTILSYTPPSSGVLTPGQAASQVVVPTPTPTPTPTVYNITDAGSNADFASGTLGPWVAGGGTGTQATTAYSGVGVGVSVVQEMTSYTAMGSPYQWTVKPPVGTYMVSIQPTSMLTSGVNSFDDMATDLGISAASKNEIIAAMVASGNGQPTNAAWIHQDITLTSGQTFHMAWQYISTDYVPFNDGSITTLVNKTGSIVATINGSQKEYALLGFTNPGTGNYSVGSYGATGWQIANYTANEAGTYRLGFGAFNLSDTALSPILFVTKDVGTTLNFTTPFGPVAPNPGSTAPNNAVVTAPTVVNTAPGTPIVVDNSVTGTPTVTTITNTNLVNSTDSNGNPVVTTYFTVTTTTTTPTTTTTTTTPVTVATYSDGSTTTSNGTPVITTAVTNTVASTTTTPAIQSVATTTDVVTTNTTSGTAVTTHNVMTWAPTSQTSITFSATKNNNIVNVNKNTIVVVDTPTTTTTTTTTPITTATTHTPTTTIVDANGNPIGTTTATPTVIDSTINQVVSNDVYADNYSASSNNVVKTADVGGAQNSINYQNQNLFIIDPFTAPDGSWVTPGYSYGKVGGGNIGGSNLAFGYQTTVGDNTVGVAGYYGSTESANYHNSIGTATSGGGTAYVLSKQPWGAVKVSGGIAYTEHSTTAVIPEFSLMNNQKTKQTNVYGDFAIYSPKEIAGWTPFAGTIVNNSSVSDGGSSGTELLAQPVSIGSKTTVIPYGGAQYTVNKDVALQAKVSQSPIFGTVASGKAVIKKEIAKNTYLNASVGYDSNGKDYNNASILVGLTVNF